MLTKSGGVSCVVCTGSGECLGGNQIEFCERNGFTLVFCLLLSLQSKQSLNTGACQTTQTVSFEISLPLFFQTSPVLLALVGLKKAVGFSKLTW